MLITCLPLPKHVRETMLGSDGALAALGRGAVWIDTSTTDYHNTLDIARMAALRDVMSLEAPVSNLSHMGVDFNNVCFYVGGEKRPTTRSAGFSTRWANTASMSAPSVTASRSSY